MTALTAAEFGAAMMRLGPFERPPHVAVAVSGGADSLALALLAAEWAAAHAGTATALTVDHGLRPESAAEAECVGGWLNTRGLEHHILRWSPGPLTADVQAAARAARYRLLEDWCAKHGVLHLLLAHHREDQAETFLLRLGRGSGVDGLSAMAAITETPRLRLVRPLLDVPRTRLRATLRAAGQPWIEDPSNLKPEFARVRLRALMPQLAAEGLSPERLAATAARLSRARSALEDLATDAAARHIHLHPSGWAECAPGLPSETAEVALRVLSRLLMAIAGRDYPPRLERLERLLAGLRAGGRGYTLAGCRLVNGPEGIRVFREAAAMAPPLPIFGPGLITWDGRFQLMLRGSGAATLQALGSVPRQIREAVQHERLAAVPGPARVALPALCDDRGIFAVPHLGYKRHDVSPSNYAVEWVEFAPPLPLTAVGHCLV